MSFSQKKKKKIHRIKKNTSRNSEDPRQRRQEIRETKLYLSK